MNRKLQPHLRNYGIGYVFKWTFLIVLLLGLQFAASSELAAQQKYQEILEGKCWSGSLGYEGKWDCRVKKSKDNPLQCTADATAFLNEIDQLSSIEKPLQSFEELVGEKIHTLGVLEVTKLLQCAEFRVEAKHRIPSDASDSSNSLAEIDIFSNISPSSISPRGVLLRQWPDVAAKKNCFLWVFCLIPSFLETTILFDKGGNLGTISSGIVYETP